MVGSNSLRAKSSLYSINGCHVGRAGGTRDSRAKGPLPNPSSPTHGGGGSIAKGATALGSNSLRAKRSLYSINGCHVGRAGGTKGF